MTPSYRIHVGDSRLVLGEYPDNHFDSCVCDPPYALESVVKRFGGPNAAPAQFGKDGAFSRQSKGFMGMTWDTGETAFDPAFWVEVLRVLKPGAYVLAFSGSRTYHRLATAIEAAGFEIRDQIMWLYGSGMPHSHDAGDGWGSNLKPAHEPIVMARKPFPSSIARNRAQYGTGATNINACRVAPTGESRERCGEASAETRYTLSGVTNFAAKPGVRGGAPAGRFPANTLHDGSDEVLEAFPQAPGQLAKASTSTATRKTQNVYGAMLRGSNGAEPRQEIDKSAARFFYCAKASKADRDEGNTHATVKPTALMRYLCRLVTPADGHVLDPFMGSGSTGKGALLEGFHFTGIDLSADYARIAKSRLEPLMPAPTVEDLFEL